jgi:hypothetical protein
MSKGSDLSSTIEGALDEVFTVVSDECGFPEYWNRSASEAHDAIRRVAGNQEKADAFHRQLYLLRDHLRDYAKRLFGSFFKLAAEYSLDNPVDQAETLTWQAIAKIAEGSLQTELFIPDLPPIKTKPVNAIRFWIGFACSGTDYYTAETLDDPWRAPGWLWRWHAESLTRFHQPETFSPEETEVILGAIETWLSAEIGKAVEIAKLKESRRDRVIEDFEVLSEDYSKVRLRRKEFYLSKIEAKIVKVLHEELQKGGSGRLSTRAINKRVGRSDRAKLSDAFRTLTNRGEDWRQLIIEDGKGIYRLNVSDADRPAAVHI